MINDDEEKPTDSQPEPEVPEDPPEPEQNLEFELELQSKPVKLKNKGVVTGYTLKELNGTDRDKYISLMSSKVLFSKESSKPIGLKNYDGVDLKLIHLSLYDASGARVSEAVIGSWPGKVVSSLAAAAMKLSGLENKTEALKAAKNA